MLKLLHGMFGVSKANDAHMSHHLTSCHIIIHGMFGVGKGNDAASISRHHIGHDIVAFIAHK